MKILFFGDIFGRVGREGLAKVVPELRRRHDPEFIIMNAENAAHGKGLTPKIAQELFALGADVLTLGNHSFDKKEIMTIIDDPRLLRPANYPEGVLGHGSGVYATRSGGKVGVIQVMGRVYMPQTDDPFRVVLSEVERLRRETKTIIVDMHAEITSEKNAMGWHLDGKVSGVVGTHTHVQTADERLLRQGTAYLTDAGFCGPYDSVIGADIDVALKRFYTGLFAPLQVATGDAIICGCIFDVDETTGRARSIERFREIVRLPSDLSDPS